MSEDIDGQRYIADLEAERDQERRLRHKVQTERDRLREENKVLWAARAGLHTQLDRLVRQNSEAVLLVAQLREENATLTRRAETAEIALRLSTTDADRLREENEVLRPQAEACQGAHEENVRLREENAKLKRWLELPLGPSSLDEEDRT
jgi:hypothetical protein